LIHRHNGGMARILNQPVIWPSPEDRDKDRQRKREALLLAAVEMFNERGFPATSLDDVAASLNVTKPVIYRYLGSKDQVLLECVKRGIEGLQAAVATARVTDGSGLDRLKVFLARYAEISSQGFGRCVHRTGDHELSADSRRQFRALKREIDGAMRSLIEDGVADGSIHAPNIRMTAFALAGALNWIARWYDPRGPMNEAEVAAEIVDTLIAGLAPRRPDDRDAA
jgi:AcrR family transcriptional regulator